MFFDNSRLNSLTTLERVIMKKEVTMKKENELLNELETAEKTAPQKPTKAESAAFYVSLKARLFALVSWLTVEAGIGEGEKASRVSLILKGASRQTGRVAKIEGGRLIITLSPLNNHNGAGKHYRPSVAFTETTDVQKAIIKMVKGDSVIRAAFVKVYQKASVYMTAESRAALKAAIQN